MPKTKSGEHISWKEALQRFKQGLEDISPIQKLENEVKGTLITLLGFIIALGAVIWKLDAIGLIGYGLILIFLGSIITTGLKYIGMRQQLKFFKETEGESIDIEDILTTIKKGGGKNEQLG